MDSYGIFPFHSMVTVLKLFWIYHVFSLNSIILTKIVKAQCSPQDIHDKSSHRSRSTKKDVLKISQISQEDTCVGVSF